MWFMKMSVTLSSLKVLGKWIMCWLEQTERLLSVQDMGERGKLTYLSNRGQFEGNWTGFSMSEDAYLVTA